jgi:hypothetical protein
VEAGNALIMDLCAFNPVGLSRFQAGLKNLAGMSPRTVGDFDRIRDIAQDETLRVVAVQNVRLPRGPFLNRFEMCSRIYDALRETVALDQLSAGSRIWDWLSAYYFTDLTTTRSATGTLRRDMSKEDSFPAYIWDRDYKKFYRHRIGHGLYMIHRLGKELSKPMLLSQPGSMSDYCEHIFARTGSYHERAVIEAANSIYFDGDKIIAGSTEERRWALQHFQREIAQYRMNFEFSVMTKEELLELVDKRFKKRAFKDWLGPGRAIASFIALNPNWVTALNLPVDCPEEAAAEQIGCMERDLQGLIRQADAQVGKTAKQRTKKAHWASVFKEYCSRNRMNSPVLIQKMKDLLLASSAGDLKDEFLIGLVESMK